MNTNLAVWDVPASLAPECLLPTQLAPERRELAARGERALMLAILEDAIRCFQEHRHGRRAEPRRLAREAEAWIRSRSERPFSFVGICEALDLPADALRRVLLSWRGRPAAADIAARGYRLNLRAIRRRAGSLSA